MAKPKRPPLKALDWEALSPDGLWRLQRIAVRAACGLSYTEIGSSLGLSSREVSRALDKLAAELEETAS